MKCEIDMEDILKKMLTNLSAEELYSALYDSGQVIKNSTHAGFIQRIGPDGDKWPDNPEWYKEMKGHTSPLTGPMTKTIKGGPFAGRYEFKDFNITRMRNNLEVRVNGASSAEVFYNQSAEERAKITQNGGKETMTLISLTGKKDIMIDLEINPRVHLAVSDSYSRIPGGTDIEHIMLIWDQLLQEHLEKDLLLT